MSCLEINFSSCAGSQVAKQWAAFPLSEETDAAQLAARIKENPAEWKAAADFPAGPISTPSPRAATTLLLPAHTPTSRSTIPVPSASTRPHRAYADVQVVLSGEEYIFIAPLDALQDRLTDFDEEKDIEFFASASSERAVLADRTHWVILFPSDAHNPCMSRGESPVHVRKVVVKVTL